MQSFIKKFLIYTAVVFAINLFFYFTIFSPVMLKDYLKPISQLQHLNHSKIILADSHGESIFQEHLNDLGISNFSFGSDNYTDMLHKLQFICNNSIVIDTVLITVDNHTLSSYREITHNNSRSIFFLNPVDYCSNYSTNYGKFIFNVHLLRYLPLFNPSNSPLFRRYLKQKLKKATNRSADGEKKQIKWQDLTKEDINKSIQDRFTYQFETAHSDSLTNSLKKIVTFCKENNMELIGVKFPLAPAYYEKTSSANFGADSVFAKLGINVIDISHQLKSDSLFVDPDHVNRTGSLQFSQILKKYLSQYE